MSTYEFTKGGWEKDFSYAYSLVAKSETEFVQEKDCIVNTYNNEINDFNYVSIVHKEKHGSGVKISGKCDFDKFGAPLITLANSLEKGESGKTLYGEHYEVVFYRGGCNIWHIVKAPADYHKKYVNTKTGFSQYEIKDGALVDFTVSVDGKTVTVTANGNEFVTEMPLLADEFYVGFTACEGINHFYSGKIE